MTPAFLLAGVLIVVILLVFRGMRTLDHQGTGTRSVQISISLFPPKFDLRVEHRSES